VTEEIIKRKLFDYDTLWNTPYLGHNRLVAVSIKTSGPDTKLHEIIQICVFPLNHNFDLAKDIIPFYTDIQPVKSRLNIDYKYIRVERFKELLQHAPTPQVVAGLFDDWMEKQIRLDDKKKLLPVVYNWAGMRPFIKNWLGTENFNYYFSERYRDIYSIALFCNDFADMKLGDVPYLKTTMVTVAKTLRVEYERHDETILQCKSISQVYKGLLNHF